MANTMTLKKLYEIKEKYMPSIDIRRGMQKNNLYQIMVCGGTGCHSCESAEVLHAFNTSIQNHKLKNATVFYFEETKKFIQDLKELTVE